MKKILCLLLICTLLMPIINPTDVKASAKEMVLEVNDYQVVLDRAPFVLGETVYISASDILERLGFVTKWDESKKTLYIKRDVFYAFHIGGGKMLEVNRKNSKMKYPSKVVAGELLLPKEFFEGIGMKVEWDKSTYTLKIYDGTLGESIGLIDAVYPSIETLGYLGLATNLQEGMALASGKGIKILVVGEDKKYRYLDIYDQTVPSSTVIYQEDEELPRSLGTYDIVAFYDYTDFETIKDRVKRNKNTLFIMAGDLEWDDEYIKGINQLAKYNNVLIVGSYLYPSTEPYYYIRHSEVPKAAYKVYKIDLYAPTNSVVKPDEVELFNEVRVTTVTLALWLEKRAFPSTFEDFKLEINKRLSSKYLDSNKLMYTLSKDLSQYKLFNVKGVDKESYHQNMPSVLQQAEEGLVMKEAKAQLKKAYPSYRPEEIDRLYEAFAISIGDKKYVANLLRVNLLANSRSIYKGSITLPDKIKIQSDRYYDFYINGVSYSHKKWFEIKTTDKFTVAINDKRDASKKVSASTQLVSLNLLRDKEGYYVIDSTFNGKIYVKKKWYNIKVGHNKLDLNVRSVDDVIITYNLK